MPVTYPGRYSFEVLCQDFFLTKTAQFNLFDLKLVIQCTRIKIQKQLNTIVKHILSYKTRYEMHVQSKFVKCNWQKGGTPTLVKTNLQAVPSEISYLQSTKVVLSKL